LRPQDKGSPTVLLLGFGSWFQVEEQIKVIFKLTRKVKATAKDILAQSKAVVQTE
jgi:hypothetical protein